MALSKRTLKRNNYASKARHLLIIAAARRMNTAAEEYNSTFQQRMSSKHHQEQALRDAVRLHSQQLWLDYRKARAAFFSLRRKHGVEFTSRVLRNVDKKPSRIAVLREAFDPKPGLVRKKIAGTTNPYAPRPALLSEHTNVGDVTEIPFEQAVVVFKHHLVSALVKDRGLTVGDAVNMVEDHKNNKDSLFDLLNQLIEKEELKVFFTRHKELIAGLPYPVTKITDV